MSAVEQVREMFKLGCTFEVVENTLRPELNQTRRRVIRAYRAKLAIEILTGPGAGRKGVEMRLPMRASDIRSITHDTVTYRLAADQHTLTLRVIA